MPSLQIKVCPSLISEPSLHVQNLLAPEFDQLTFSDQEYLLSNMREELNQIKSLRTK